MFRDELGSLAAFVAVADAQSFTRAAGQMGVSQSALSHKIRRLEARLGVRLLTRTTRSVSLTEAGATLALTLRPALDSIDMQLGALVDGGDKPAGNLRISSADHAAETILWPALQRLLPQYPSINVEVVVDNELVDIVAQRFDAGIRLGKNLDKDMIAVPIGPPERQVIVGSAGYLAANPAPVRPEDLSTHRCISRRMPTLGGFSPWPFSKGGQQQKIRVSGQLAMNRPEMILEAAIAGFGLACLLESQAISAIRAGFLVAVLEDWCPSFPGYHLYYPNRRQNVPAFQVLVEALRYR